MKLQRICKTNLQNYRGASPASACPKVSNSIAVPPFLQLQQTLGNRAVGRFIQAKLTINQPGDVYKQGADRKAEQVTRMTEPLPTMPFDDSPPTLQRKCAACASGHSLSPNCPEEEKMVQRKTLAAQITPVVQRQMTPASEEDEELLQAKEIPGKTPTVSLSMENQIANLRGSRQPLPDAVHTFFEPRFEHDFSQVRVHTDAQAVNAMAYTVERDVVFGAGQYALEINSGKKLLAHELTHVLQQDSAGHTFKIHRRVIDDDAHVTCRGTRPGAVATLRTAETDAISLAQRAALIIRLQLAFHPLISIVGETPTLRRFRDILWRRFHFDYNQAQVRHTLLPIWARRYELVADWISRLNHRYICGASGTEPPGECTTRPGAGIAWTATGVNRTQLCDFFWGQSADDRAETILHEWFHFGFDWLEDCGVRNRNNTVCYDMFAGELAGTAAPADYAACCAPPAGPLPPLAGVP